MPGTAFPDPHRTNFPVSHSLDMDHRIKTHDDEKALAAPTGLTSAYTATLAPIDYDERRALRTTWTMRQPADYLQWGEGHTKSMTVRGEFLRTTRGAIGCRTNSLNALMASGVRPDATLLPRTHEEERQFARSIPKFKPEHAVLDRVVMRFSPGLWKMSLSPSPKSVVSDTSLLTTTLRTGQSRFRNAQSRTLVFHRETLLNATAFPVITATHLPDFLASRIFVWVTQSASIQRCFTSMDATTPRVSSWSAKPLREK